MVEPLRELGKKCQKPDYKKVGNWMVRHILRDAALPITRLLLHTNITANQVTLIALCVGVAGCFVLCLPGPFFFFIAVLLLQTWYLLDHVDGQIARYRNTACLTGRYYDFLMHHIVHVFVFLGLGFYAALQWESVAVLIWGFFASLALFFFNLISDIKAKTMREALEKGARPKGVSEPSAKADNAKRKPGLLRISFSFLHKMLEIHVMMNVLTVLAIFQIFWNITDYRLYAFLFYALTAPFLAIAKNAYIIRSRGVDTEYDGLKSPLFSQYSLNPEPESKE